MRSKGGTADYITHPCLKQIRINLQMRRPLSCSRCGERLDWPLILETKRTKINSRRHVMPEHDEEMKSPEDFQGQADKDITTLKYRLLSLQDEYEMVLRDEIKKEVEKEQAEYIEYLRKQLVEKDQAIADIQVHRVGLHHDIKGLQEELAVLKCSYPTKIERPALNMVYEHDQRAEEDYKTVGVLFSLINEVCCKAQDAIHNMDRMASLRSYCANVLPLKALGMMPKRFRDNAENICKPRILSEAKEPLSPAKKLRTIARWFDAEQGSSKHPTWEGDDVQMFLLDLAALLDRKEEIDTIGAVR